MKKILENEEKCEFTKDKNVEEFGEDNFRIR